MDDANSGGWSGVGQFFGTVQREKGIWFGSQVALHGLRAMLDKLT